MDWLSPSPDPIQRADATDAGAVDLGAVEAFLTNRLHDWASSQESVTPDARWGSRKRWLFGSTYETSATEASWIKSGAIDYVAPTYPDEVTTTRAVSGSAVTVKILRAPSNTTIGGIVPLDPPVLNMLHSIGRDRPYKTPGGEQPPCWNYFRSGPGLSNPGEGHFLITELTAGLITLALLDTSAGDIERKLYIQFEDGNTQAVIRIQVMLAEPMRVVHYSPGAALSGSLYELHVYDTRGYLLNKHTSGGAIYNVTTEDPDSFYTPSLLDFAEMGEDATDTYTYLQIINHIWQNYCRVVNLTGNPATGWQMFPTTGAPGTPLSGGFDNWPNNDDPTTIPKDQKFAWANAAAAIDNLCDQNGIFVAFDPRTNTASLQKVSGVRNVDTDAQLIGSGMFYRAGELGTVYSPFTSQAVQRHLVAGIVRVVFPTRWAGGQPETSPSDANALAINNYTSYDTLHPNSTAERPINSDIKQTKMLYDSLPAVFDSSNNLQNEGELLLRLDYLADQYWDYVTARVGTRTDIGFHDYITTEDAYSIVWQLGPDLPYTHLNGQWRRPGALYPWDRDPSGVEFVGLGGTQVVQHGRGRFAIQGGSGAVVGVEDVYVVSLSPFMVRVQKMDTPGVWTNLNSTDILAYPDAFAIAEIAAGDTMSDHYIEGRTYLASTINGVIVVRSRRVGINYTRVYVSNVAWTHATCTLTKTTRTAVYEDGLLQSDT